MAITRIKNNQITDSTITNVKIATGTLTGDLMNPTLTFNSNLTLNGNLIVTGNVTAVQSTSTQITDPLITLGMGNPGIGYDLGTVLTRGSGGNRFMGWKESAAAFVFINTPEDGTTTGNITTTAYSNVILGNVTTLGSSAFGGLTLSGNTITAAGGLVLTSQSGTTTISNATVLSSTLAVASTINASGTATVNALISNGAIQGTTIGGSGVATFASVVSNGAIQGTTIGASGNLTAAALTVNGSATVGTTLSATGGVQNTPIGNGTASTGAFTTLQASTSFNTGGTATVNALVSNGAIQGTAIGASGNVTANGLTVNNSATVGTTLSALGGIQNTVIGNVTAAAGFHTTLQASTSFNTGGTATVNALISNGAIQGTTIGGSGTATFASVVSNGAIQGTTIGGSGTATFASVVSNGAIQGTAITGSGNATVAALTVNASATMATLGVTGNTTTGNISVTGLATVNSLTILGGLQNTPIGNATASTGAFTTLQASTSFNTGGTATVNALVSNGAIQGTTIGGSGVATFASVVSNGAIQGTTIGGSGTATFASVVSNGAIQGTTIGASGNATVAALTVNGSATVGTTLSATGGIQNTPIGNGTASSGSFTTLNASGAITGATTIVTTGAATHSAITSNTSITAASGTITGNLVVGNLNVQGNLSYINSQALIVQDPIVELNTGANGAPLVSNPGFDSGIRPHYYDTADRSAFFGRINSSGFFEYYSNVTSEVGNVVTGTYGTIKSGNLLLTGKANVVSDMTIGGALIANQFTVNTSFSASSVSVTGDIISTAGNIRANAGQVSAANGFYSGNLTVLGNINGVTNVTATNAGVFYGNAVTGIGALYAGIPAGYSIVPNAVAQFSGNANSYVQINAQNINTGNDATTDWIATSAEGTDSTYYIDMGIVSKNYDNLSPTNSLGTSVYGGDGYLYTQGNLDTTYGGNLVIGTQTGNKIIRFIAGGHDAADITATISNTSMAILRTTASTNSTNGALTVAGGLGVVGAINGGSTINTTGAATHASVISNGAIQGTAITGSGNATVAALTVNASATVGTTLGVTGNLIAGNISTPGLASVGQITILGGIQNTPIGNATASTGVFTTLQAGTSFNTGGTATVNALVSNGAIQGTTIGGSGTATFASVVSNGAIQGTTIGGSGTATFASVVSNGAIQGTAITGSGIGTFASVVSNAAIQGTNITGSGTGQFNTLTVNTSSVIGGNETILGDLYIGTGANATAFTNPILVGRDSGAGFVQVAIVNTLGNASADFTAYANNGTDVQGWMDMGMTGNVFNDANYTITGFNDGYIFANGVTGNSSLGGNLVIATGSGGATNDIVFATGGFWSNKEVMRFSNSTQAFQVKTTTRATGTTSGALQVSGGVGIAGNLYAAGVGTLGNITFSNTTISSNLTNTGITINPNGTGPTVINSGLNNSRTVINGTQANVFVVSGAQVGANINTFVSGASFQIGSNDAMLLPVGSQGERPASPSAGMFRYSTSTSGIEWYTGSAWATAGTLFTIAVANTQQGNGSSTTFTLPVANATTAGTIVSINGIVQQPITAYSVSGSTVTFTEAPSSTDVVDFRVFSTTQQVTTVTDTAGTTGLFLEIPTPSSKIILFRTNGTESLSIQANSDVIIAGNILPSGNAVANIGSVGRQFNTIFAKASSAQYADLAENYLADDNYPAGTVVVFGGDKEITVSSKTHDERVAGVISTNPAYLMNSGLKNGLAVAFTGRVPCKVMGPIYKGQPLVQGGNKGMAEGLNPDYYVPGCVFGKALENVDAGVITTIEVVVGRY